MADTPHQRFDQETIDQLGLRRSELKLNIQAAPEASIFEYPGLDGVYIMECDLYGNPMPEGSCFLAFEGRSGMVGTHLSVDTLKKSSIADIRKIADDNSAG